MERGYVVAWGDEAKIKANLTEDSVLVGECQSQRQHRNGDYGAVIACERTDFQAVLLSKSAGTVTVASYAETHEVVEELLGSQLLVNIRPRPRLRPSSLTC